MKKIFLLALLLGLTGCGNDNQNGASQADSSHGLGDQTIAKTMSASSLSLGGWTVTNSSAAGASTILEAAKDTRVSAALITPNAIDVAKILRGGAAGIALSLAVDQILGAVDWVLDPANNTIKYKIYVCNGSSTGSDNNCPYYINNFINYGTFSSVASAAAYYFDTLGVTYTSMECTKLNLDTWRCQPLNAKNQYGYSIGAVNVEIRINPETVEKTLPLETVAEQVIDNADNDNPDAQVATNAAAQAILAEAYNDAVKAQPIVTELENNARDNCPGGVNNNGSCWICNNDLKYPYVRATKDAKFAARGKSCKETMDESTKAANAALWVNLITARLRENACWLPSDRGHLIALVENYKALQNCTE